MILKYKTTPEKNGEKCDMWNYVDGITSCSVFYNTDPSINRPCIEFGRGPGLDQITLPLYEEAYLINDTGKTIEKIAY